MASEIEAEKRVKDAALFAKQDRFCSLNNYTQIGKVKVLDGGVCETKCGLHNMQRNLPITMTTVLCTRLLRHFLRFATPLTSVMIVLLVFGLKEFLHDYGFRCECRLTDDQRSVPAERVAIGSLYIAVPAVTLWIVGVIMSRTTWRCLVGCGKQPACEYCGRRTACFFQTLAKSALAPIAWLFFVFLDGSYLECVMAPVPKHCAMNSTAASTGGAATDDSDDIVLISQIIALSLVAGSLLLYMLVTMAMADALLEFQLRYLTESAAKLTDVVTGFSLCNPLI
ncbi:hypothetical protein CAPTEDRAFT_198039 [Capitella teleta]|uniref:Uncharacterized protein n=1 Tax=Capitella teleta TaxID=283909 RepID=R7U7X8_CAPTE|nr:hypothetical protein CAPTEDRAFT_198039 [Capitella teleta]|eukprot:ELU02445.1 hypothetical protein CAPTEDRAFT_198039 [Capitella teleta]